MTFSDRLLRLFAFAPADEPAGPTQEDIDKSGEPTPDELGLRETAIDLTPEDLEKAGVEPEAPKPEDINRDPTTGEKRKNRRPATQRIGELTGKVRERDEALAAANSELARVNAEKADLARQKEEAEKTGFIFYEQSARANADKAKRAYKEAVDSGDSDAMANAQELIAKHQAEIAQIEAYKARQPAEPDQRQQRQQPQQRQPTQRQQPTQVAPEVVSWVSQNPWFEPPTADRPNPDFDEEMHDDVSAFANRIERRYKREGKENLIGSKAYFDELDAYARHEFPDAFEDAPAPRTPANSKLPAMNAGRQNVAAPSRTSGSMPGNQPGSPTRVTLSAEERALARKLGMKHPNGKPYSDAEHERAFALSKVKLIAQDATAE